jgi:hypothetical protein
MEPKIDNVNTEKKLQLYELTQEGISRRGYTIDGDKATKIINNDIKIFVSKNDDGITIGYENIKQDKDKLVDILSQTPFKSYRHFFSETVIDEENSRVYTTYLLKDKTDSMPEIMAISAFIFLLNCLETLEYKYSKK